jgi:hypothetical protein
MSRPSPNALPSIEPAAEQAAHPMSGPRRRPRALRASSVSRRQSGRTTHITRPPRFPVRFSPKGNGRRPRPDTPTPNPSDPRDPPNPNPNPDRNSPNPNTNGNPSAPNAGRMQAFVRGCKEGAAIVADAAIPLADPFESAGFYDDSTPGGGASRFVADVSIGLVLTAANIRGLAELTRGATRGTTLYRIGNNPTLRIGYGPGWRGAPGGRAPRISAGQNKGTKVHWDLRVCGR